MGTDGICLDVIMVGTWVLCGNGRNLSGRYHGWHMGALWERTEFVWTLSWLAHSVGAQRVCLDVIMVGTWMLCGNGRNLSGRCGRDDVFRHSKSSKHRKYQGFRGLHARAAAPPQNTREAERFQLQSPRSTANTDAVGLCAARVYSTSVPITRNPPNPILTIKGPTL